MPCGKTLSLARKLQAIDECKSPRLYGGEMDKSYRANASQFFVAGELCRQGYIAVVTMGNSPNTDDSLATAKVAVGLG